MLVKIPIFTISGQVSKWESSTAHAATRVGLFGTPCDPLVLKSRWTRMRDGLTGGMTFPSNSSAS